MLNWLRRLRARRLPPRIDVLPDGFDLVAPDGERRPIRWASVTKIATYKIDLFTIDEIVLAIEVAESPGMVQLVSEEWAGFHDLRVQMEEHFGLSPDWYSQVMHPAFAPNYRVLYEKGAARAPDGVSV
jgi:hypothetical protein